MVILFFTKPDNSFNFTNIESIANTIIAILTLILAYYVFVYQRKQDRKAKKETIEQHGKNIKLQWFKELIIQPQIDDVFNFFNNLNDLKNRINSNELTESNKIELISFIKNEQSQLRKSFLDLVQFISTDLHSTLISNLDTLTDSLTETISNDELKLSNKNTYEREIDNKIQYSYSEFMSAIFNYSG